MAILNTDRPTLLDWAKLRDPGGETEAVVELLEQRSPIVRSMVWKEGNLPTGDMFTSRTALPSIGWRRYNEGYEASKGATAQVTETTGMMVGRSEVDKDLVELHGGLQAARMVEDRGFLQSFVREAETGFLYHSTKATPEKIMGLTPRLDSTTGPFGDQIVLANPNATGNDNTSIWMITWGLDTVYGIFPKGSKAGLESIDMGLQYVKDRDNREFLAYCTDWSWKLGLAVKDARYLVRIANIDEVAMDGDSDTLIEALIDASARMNDFTSGRTVIYCNRAVWSALWKQDRRAARYTLEAGKTEGGPRNFFRGIPIEITDGLRANEAAVS